MPVFSKFWPFNNSAPLAKSRSVSPTNNPGTKIKLERGEQASVFTMNALSDGGQADMDATFELGVDGANDVVESVEQEQVARHETGRTTEGGDRKTLAAGVMLADASDKPGSHASRPGDAAGDGKCGEQSHSPEQYETTDSTYRENLIENAPLVQKEGAPEEQLSDHSHYEHQKEGHPHTKPEPAEDERMIDLPGCKSKVAQYSYMNNKLESGEQASAVPRLEQSLPSSPLPAYKHGLGEQLELSTTRDEPPSDPSSDTIFMRQMSAHFGHRNRADESQPIKREGSPNNMLDDAVEYFQEAAGDKTSPDAQLNLARSTKFQGGFHGEDAGRSEKVSERKISSGIHDEQVSQQHAARLDTGHLGDASRGLYEPAPWNGQGWEADSQQPYQHVFQGTSLRYSDTFAPHPMENFSPIPQLSFRNKMSNPHGKQSYTSQLAPGIPDYMHSSASSPTMQGGQVPDQSIRGHRVFAQPSHQDQPRARIPMKRKHEEAYHEDPVEEFDEYLPSGSGDDDDSDSEEDIPLMYRRRAEGGSAQRKRPVMRSGSDSHSEYHDEEEQDQDEDKAEESDEANAEEQATGQQEVERFRNIDVDSGNPVQEPDEEATGFAPNLTIQPPLPCAPAGSPAIQRALPAPQPQAAVEPAASDEISFKLPQYHVEVIPMKTKDDFPEVRVNLPGMPREQLILTPDHAHQEIHLLKHLFMPGQQNLETPDPQPMIALLNFHTVATMVLEAYTAYEVGDLEAKTSTSSSKKKNDTEALDATKDEIFFAIIDRWRVGMAEETLKPSYKLIRGVQEFCDIALDVIYYLEEHGFVEGPQMMRKERSDKGLKKSKDGKVGGGKLAGADEDVETSDESTPKKRGRPKKGGSESPAKSKGKAKGDANTLQARKKAKATPKAASKKTIKAKKEPMITVVKKGKM